MAYANLAGFKKKITSPYRVTYPLEAVFMISNHAGIIKEIACIDEIHSLAASHGEPKAEASSPR